MDRDEATLQAAEVPRAVAAVLSTVATLDLRAGDAEVLHDSNRLAVRIGGDVLARVGPAAFEPSMAFEVEVARRLADTESPVALPAPRVEPRVYLRDGFAVTLWTYYEPAPPRDLAPREYAQALQRLHAGMRHVEMSVPHFTDRVAEAQRLIGNRADTPELAGADRELLAHVLQNVTTAILDRGAPEQVLHGEPHPGNLLRTEEGLLFIDLETCCRGPVEFDLAHAPDDVAEHYPTADRDLLRACRILTLALAVTWRWDRDDDLPNGRQLGEEWLREIRAALDQGRSAPL